jgi:hypothetical protein
MAIFSPFNIVIITSSPAYEIIEVQLKWGYFSMAASILNIKDESVFHPCRSSSGANAHVYHI